MKKFKLYTLLVVQIFFSCSSDDDSNSNTNPDNNLLTPVSINFVYRDGSPIQSGECLSDQDEYAIEIQTIDETNGQAQVTQVDYTFNGSLYSMSFIEAGTLRNPVNLIDGDNLSQLLQTGLIDEVRFLKQNDYVLVD